MGSDTMRDAGGDTGLLNLYWLTTALFLSYLLVAMSMPTTTLFVVTRLHLGSGLAGLAVGIAFASTIVTRGWAGRIADEHGGKYCACRGLVLYVLAGFVCLGATLPALPVALSYGILIAGRLLLGIGESLTIVGVIQWGLGLLGPARSGRVMALVGMGLYGSFAAGSPLGLTIYDRWGFVGLLAVGLLMPALGLAMARAVPRVEPHRGHRKPILSVLREIWAQGTVICLQGVGFAVIGAFMPLLFLHHHWPHAGLGLTAFGGAFVLVRVFCGKLPDRLGGVPVALVSMSVEACGQYTLWAATDPWVALAGAFLSGLGCSMMFPAMGVEVVRRVAPQLRGTAMGAFAACQDLAYGLSGPLLGGMAEREGFSSVFLAGGIAATLGLGLVVVMARVPHEDRA
ncbi:arabinose transporter [Brytella acorum]|uniref:Uncharacterized MFS-type transporter LMG32879_002401 n=1 Tax=Brytella acorum TaxID=2959299 RepID=A0AA35VC88_9PROT|nr:arabinose transporter [Brytella acorum]MDF3625382.1 arabinose transporter [Brytella acorum]CAI9121554.1 arabinose transporter [Brytella acorum]